MFERFRKKPANVEWPLKAEPSYENNASTKAHQAIDDFIKTMLMDKMDIIHYEAGRQEAETYLVSVFERTFEETIEERKFIASFSPVTMNEAGNNFATRMGLIEWGWVDFKRKRIGGFDEHNVWHEYFVNNWTDYIMVLSFRDLETGEIIYNEPKITPERDLAGYFANLVKVNMAYFHLLSEKIANEGRVEIYADVFNEGKNFTKRELKALVNEIEGIGYSVICDYVTGKMQLDFSDDVFETSEEELNLTDDELAYIEAIE